MKNLNITPKLTLVFMIFAGVLLLVGFKKTGRQGYNAAGGAFRGIILRRGILDGVIAEAVFLERLVNAGQRRFQHHRHLVVR